jgi:hypothetical protein
LPEPGSDMPCKLMCSSGSLPRAKSMEVCVVGVGLQIERLRVE